MKVPLSRSDSLDLDAPALPAYAVRYKGKVRWLVWCKYCKLWHRHGPAEGHREAHCLEADSPYQRTGYNLALAGRDLPTVQW
jgi:hypothetical protein